MWLWVDGVLTFGPLLLFLRLRVTATGEKLMDNIHKTRPDVILLGQVARSDARIGLFRVPEFSVSSLGCAAPGSEEESPFRGPSGARG